jgi:UDPglucose 6-dehydrogenase
MFASKGIRVFGVEIDDKKLTSIGLGKPPFYEPKLECMLNDVINEKFLTVSNDVATSVKSSTISFICVGTPAQSNGTPYIADIVQAAKEIGSALATVNNYHVVVVKSSVPPGTTENVVGKNIATISKGTVNQHFGLACNPEFLKQGSAIDDSFSPHILVIGSNGSKTEEMLVSFYKPLFPQSQPELIQTNISTAELIKFANNSFIANKISFINTIGNICSRIPNVDVETVAKAIGLDPRIGKLFLRAGPGYGGSCLPKDIAQFINFSHGIGYDPVLLRSTRRVNEHQLSVLLDMIVDVLKGRVKGKKIAILGLAFKNNTDDVRESRSLQVIRKLKRKDAIIKVHDPLPTALENTRRMFGKSIEYFTDHISCITNVDCCTIMTEWSGYKDLDATTFKQYMKKANVVDARRILDHRRMDGINYIATGLGRCFPHK